MGIQCNLIFKLKFSFQNSKIEENRSKICVSTEPPELNLRITIWEPLIYVDSKISLLITFEYSK